MIESNGGLNHSEPTGELYAMSRERPTAKAVLSDHRVRFCSKLTARRSIH
jgi:hypothetical protein